MVDFNTWAKQKFTDKSVRPGKLKFGGAYLFAYKPRSRENMTDIDLMPVFIITSYYANTIWGINIIKIPNKELRMKILRQYVKALESKSETELAKSLYDIRRAAQIRKDTASAYMPYKWNNIKSRIIPLEIEDLEQLIKRVL